MMLRGKVTNVTSAGVFVQTADFGTVGPCQWTGERPVVGTSVLVADVGNASAPDLVIVGKIGTDGGQYVTSTAAAGSYNGYFLKSTAADGTQKNRWFIGKSNAAESGSDAGSNFIIWAYADDGSQTLKPLTIYRNTGRVVLGVAGVDGGVDIGLNGPRIIQGTGAPTVTAPDGSLYLRTDGGAGSTLYVRETGAWVAK